jgi:ATP-dependent RNA helicase A
MIIISSMGEERSLFVDPPGHRRAAKASRAHYVVDSSDHLGFINAFKEMRWRMNKYGQSNAWEHGQENFIHFGVFRSILFTTQSIKQTLVGAGLIEEQFGSLASSDFEIGGKALNTNSGNVGLVKGLLLAGLYPNIGVRAKEQRAPVYKTMYEDKVWIHPSSTNNAPRNQITFHPSSMNNALTPNDDSVYTYGELARSIAGDTLFMRNTTPVTPLMGILFGGRIATNRYAELMMDDWLVFKMRTETFTSAPKEAAQLTLELRKAKDRMLNGVFASLHENGKILAHDPPRELLVSGVAALLEHQRACEQYGSMEPEVPSGWMEWGAGQDKTIDRSRDQATTAWRGRW